MIFHLQWRFPFFLLSFHSCFSGGFSICSEDFIFSFAISVMFFWIIFCREDFRFFIYHFISVFLFFSHFITVFLEHFLRWRFQTFHLSFHSCFSGSFSAVKISDFSFIISFLFFQIIFCCEDFRFFIYHFIPVFPDHFLLWRFQTFNLAFHSCFSGSFSAVKISDFSFIISFLFFWSIFCSEDLWFSFLISFMFSLNKWCALYLHEKNSLEKKSREHVHWVYFCLQHARARNENMQHTILRKNLSIYKMSQTKKHQLWNHQLWKHQLWNHQLWKHQIS